MTVIYDMETGDIESEQVPGMITRDHDHTGPGKAVHTALQQVSPPDTTAYAPASDIHLIQALLERL